MAQPSSRISVTMHCWHHRCVLNRSCNIKTKFSNDWLDSKQMATVFRNARIEMMATSIWILVTLHFPRHRCVLIWKHINRIWYYKQYKQLPLANRPYLKRVKITGVFEWGNLSKSMKVSPFLYYLTNHWTNSKEMATVIRNPRWQHKPSWKVHFQLNGHYEKRILSS